MKTRSGLKYTENKSNTSTEVKTQKPEVKEKSSVKESVNTNTTQTKSKEVDNKRPVRSSERKTRAQTNVKTTVETQIQEKKTKTEDNKEKEKTPQRKRGRNDTNLMKKTQEIETQDNRRSVRSSTRKTRTQTEEESSPQPKKAKTEQKTKTKTDLNKLKTESTKTSTKTTTEENKEKEKEKTQNKSKTKTEINKTKNEPKKSKQEKNETNKQQNESNIEEIKEIESILDDNQSKDVQKEEESEKMEKNETKEQNETKTEEIESKEELNDIKIEENKSKIEENIEEVEEIEVIEEEEEEKEEKEDKKEKEIEKNENKEVLNENVGQKIVEEEIIDSSPEIEIIEDEKEEPMDEELEIISETTQVKRKSSESEPLAPKQESVKRQRVSRFSVPSIPQLCGQLYSFGEEIAGELGPRLKRVEEIKLKSNEPSIVRDRDGLSLDNIVSVVCGAMHSTCLSSEGEVITFGCNDDSALGRDTQTISDQTDDSIDIDVDESEEKEAKTPKIVSGIPAVVKITAGDMHTCVLCKDGTVYIWGNFKDESKKIGLFVESETNGNSDDYCSTALPKQIQMECKIVDIASGCHHILLLTEDGDVFSLGEGSKGQLGRIKENELQLISSDRQLFLSPQKVDFGVDVIIEKVWANHWSSYAKSTSNEIYVWGLNNYHQLGFKSNTSIQITNSDPNVSQKNVSALIELKPIKVEEMPPNIQIISNGQHHMLALDSQGQVFSCGSNTYGKLGYKTDNLDQTGESLKMIEKSAFNDSKVTHISCGEFCSFAITESGHLMAWGQGSAHIGSVDFTDIEVPTRVKGSLADDTRFITISSGSQHSLLIGNKNTINGN